LRQRPRSRHRRRPGHGADPHCRARGGVLIRPLLLTGGRVTEAHRRGLLDRDRSRGSYGLQVSERRHETQGGGRIACNIPHAAIADLDESLGACSHWTALALALGNSEISQLPLRHLAVLIVPIARTGAVEPHL